MLPPSAEPSRHGNGGDDVAALPHVQASNKGKLLGWTSPMRALDGQLEQVCQGNAFLQLHVGNKEAMEGLQAGTATRRSAGITMPRPVSLGEVLGWSAARKANLSLPSVSPLCGPHSSTCSITSHTVLAAWPGERFVLRHGDNYGHVQTRRPDGGWETVAAVADYMPAGADRRYLREVGNAYGEFQRRRSGTWVSESPAHGRQVRLYLIDGRFEMLTDAQHARRARPASSQNAWPALLTS